MCVLNSYHNRTIIFSCMNVIQLTFSVKCTLCVHTTIMSTSYDTVGTSHCNNNVVISVYVGEYQQCVHPGPIYSPKTVYSIVVDMVIYWLPLVSQNLCFEYQIKEPFGYICLYHGTWADQKLYCQCYNLNNLLPHSQLVQWHSYVASS